MSIKRLKSWNPKPVHVPPVLADRRYNLLNNAIGWAVFAIALLTYWLTLEPTASYWDCGEFIIQADKLEVGHPPGNPIFMLTARFFANFAPSAKYVAVAVNAMSGLLSALTILLLFWTITHLVRRLVVRDSQTAPLSLAKSLVIFGSGVVGALAYTWSDTFWFSAVEGEVYAFSSFCTALVFWLILKWEDRADIPGSDRYLILIAYIIGVSVAVHLLNLLCIPAIVLVFCYRRFEMDLIRSLVALLVSFAIIVLVLYGLVPGFIKVAQWFELFFVNSCSMSYNSGALIYAFTTLIVFIWALCEITRQRSAGAIRLSFFIAVAISGMLFIGSGLWFGILLLACLAAWLWIGTRKNGVPVRVMNIILWSMSVIFVGYSSYALILIRSTAATPMNQNAPDNVFDLASYLNREQYGENPLLYGETLYSGTMKEVVGQRVDTIDYYEDGTPAVLITPSYAPIIEKGKPLYVKGVKGAVPRSEYGFIDEYDLHSAAQKADKRDYYVKRDYKPEPKMNPELNMLFPRLYSRQHAAAYRQWVRLDTGYNQLQTLHALTKEGEKVIELDVNSQPVYNQATGQITYAPKTAFKPTFTQNLAYFFNYQLNHMYMRYFMWNFAGRQNDINNQQGELDAGNWISGIPFIDNPRLGDQSLLPEDLGRNNPGHNVYFMLPLIFGLIGLVWQSFAGRRGLEQFWVVFFLFFMTGIAIVLYLNQTPGQPRERDYAFAGSFYAFAIWIGLGVAGLWRFFCWIMERRRRNSGSLQTAAEAAEEAVSPSGAYDNEEPEQSPAAIAPARSKPELLAAAAAVVLGLLVPIQMVSQTWDDHDRSHRTVARDYAVNYLESLEPNAIIFCNGDNDTFPLWYAQEVEGVRPDVKIINLSYLNSDWYANQQRMPSYSAKPVDFTATPADYAYGRMDVVLPGTDTAPMDLSEALKYLYSGQGFDSRIGYNTLPSGVVRIPVDRAAVIKAGAVAKGEEALIPEYIYIDLRNAPSVRSKGYVSLGELLMLDIIATNAANGWKRPIYWASTVGSEYHLGLSPYLRGTGMAHQLTAVPAEGDIFPRSDRAYDVVTGKYLWGGADGAKKPYYDETARRMMYTMRMSMVDLAETLEYEGVDLLEKNPGEARKAFDKALKVLDLAFEKQPESVGPWPVSLSMTAANVYCQLGKKEQLNRPALIAKGRKMFENMLVKNAPSVRYAQSMMLAFGNPTLTYETQYAPYIYWRIAELYLANGGSQATLDRILKENRLNGDVLRQYYEAYTTGRSGAAAAGEADDEMTLDQIAQAIGQYAEVYNHVKSLPADSLQYITDEERMIADGLPEVIDYYLQSGGSIEELRKYPEFVKYEASNPVKAE